MKTTNNRKENEKMITVYSKKHPDYAIENEDGKINTDLIKAIARQSDNPEIQNEFRNKEDYYGIVDKIYTFNLEHPYIKWFLKYGKVATKAQKDVEIPDRGYWDQKGVIYKPIYNKKKVRKNNVELLTNNFTKDYVVLDVETTGLNPEFDSIIQFSAIKYHNDQEVDELDLLLSPSGKNEVSDIITNITGIKASDLIGKPTYAKEYKKIHDFLGDLPWIGHNLKFDISMITAEDKRINKPLPQIEYFDTLKMARKALPYLGKGEYRLEKLKNRINNDELANLRSHNSLNDARITAALYRYLRNRMEA